MGRRPQMVYVEWLDHADTGDPPWQAVAELDTEPPVCKSVGWIVRRTKTAFVLAGTISDDHVSQTFILLRSAIVRMEKLSEP